MTQAWELSAKTQISAAVKLTFRGEKNVSMGKRNWLYKKRKKGSTGSTLNTLETYEAHLHAAIAHLGHIIVNTVTRCYSCGLATGLNAVILTRFCTMFRLRESECYESFESDFFKGARFQSFSFESIPIPTEID